MRFATSVLLLSTTILASPIPDAGIGRDDATCELQWPGGGLGKYVMFIGEPIANKAGCEPIKKTIEKDYDVNTSHWKCEDDGHGMTYIEFYVRYQTDKVNAAMKEAYPMIDWGTDENPKCDPYDLLL